MADKTITIKSRLKNKYKTLADWNKLAENEFVPLKGEVCYGVDDKGLYIKVGDGNTDFTQLPWQLNQSDQNENDKTAPGYIKNRLAYKELSDNSEVFGVLDDSSGQTETISTEGSICFFNDTILKTDWSIGLEAWVDNAETSYLSLQNLFIDKTIVIGEDDEEVKYSGNFYRFYRFLLSTEEDDPDGILAEMGLIDTKEQYAIVYTDIGNESVAYVWIDKPYTETFKIELSKNAYIYHQLPADFIDFEAFDLVGQTYPDTVFGEVFNDYSNNISSGKYSHAEGKQTTAIAESSHAEGCYSTASGEASHVEGWKNEALGKSSHAEGNLNSATGECSHAEGQNNRATGTSSHVEGTVNSSLETNAHVEGCYRTSSGSAGHVEGIGLTQHASNAISLFGTYIDKYTFSATLNSLSQFYSYMDYNTCYITLDEDDTYYPIQKITVSSQNNKVTFKLANFLPDKYIGQDSFKFTLGRSGLRGEAGHIEGFQTAGDGKGIHVEGVGTIGEGQGAHVQGCYNGFTIKDDYTTDLSNYAHIVGNGTSLTERSNAHTLDWEGNAWYAGTITSKGLEFDPTTKTRGYIAAKDLIDPIIKFNAPTEVLIRNSNLIVLPTEDEAKANGSSLAVNEDGTFTYTQNGLETTSEINISPAIDRYSVLPKGDYIFGLEITECSRNITDTEFLFQGLSFKVQKGLQYKEKSYLQEEQIQLAFGSTNITDFFITFRPFIQFKGIAQPRYVTPVVEYKKVSEIDLSEYDFDGLSITTSTDEGQNPFETEYTFLSKEKIYPHLSTIVNQENRLRHYCLDLKDFDLINGDNSKITLVTILGEQDENSKWKSYYQDISAELLAAVPAYGSFGDLPTGIICPGEGYFIDSANNFMISTKDINNYLDSLGIKYINGAVRLRRTDGYCLLDYTLQLDTDTAAGASELMTALAAATEFRFQLPTGYNTYGLN